MMTAINLGVGESQVMTVEDLGVGESQMMTVDDLVVGKLFSMGGGKPNDDS